MVYEYLEFPPNDSDHAKCGGVLFSTPSSVFLLAFALPRAKRAIQLTSNKSGSISLEVLEFSGIVELDVLFRTMT